VSQRAAEQPLATEGSDGLARGEGAGEEARGAEEGALPMEGDSESEDGDGDELEAAEVDAVEDATRREACDGVIGAAGVAKNAPAGTITTEFSIRFTSEEPFEKWWVVAEEDFPTVISNPPTTDRESLGWDARLIGVQVIMFLLKIGYTGWYVAKVTEYDAETKKHTLAWDDGDKDSKVNLLACKIASEWRLVQADEDIEEALMRLNAEHNAGT